MITAGDPVANEMNAKRVLTGLILFLTLSLTGVNWWANTVDTAFILTEVNPISKLAGLESTRLYAGLLIFTGIFPLVFGFLPQLKFHKLWRTVLLANLPVTLFFMAWDIYFTHIGVWSFSERYTTGFRFIQIPWEEWMFFIIIPTACLFIYWSLNHLIRAEPFAKLEKGISYTLAIGLLLVAIWKWDHIYTVTTALLTSGFLLWHLQTIPGGYRGRYYLTYLVSCIPFLLVNGVLTGGFTEGPVVMYNTAEYFGIRIGTIPADDFVYSFLMLFGNVTAFEFLYQQKRKRRTA